MTQTALGGILLSYWSS